MKNALFIFILLLAGQSFAQTSAADSTFYASLISHTFSEPTSIDSLLHDFRGDIQSGDHAYTFSRAETGLQWKGFVLGYQFRYDYWLKFSEDVARTYHATSHDQAIPVGLDQQVNIDASHIRAHGPAFGFHWQPKKHFSFNGKLILLFADKMVAGNARGNLGLIDEDSYRGEVRFLLDSSEDLLLEVPVPEPKGQGFTLDMGFQWAVTESLQLDFNVMDAWSRIRWQDVLYSDLYANSATVVYDSDGGLHTNPILSGYQYLYDTRQTLPIKYQARLSYQVANKHRFYVEPFYVAHYVTQIVAGYQHIFSTDTLSDTVVGGYWNQTTDAFGFTLQRKMLTLGVGTDKINGRKARAWDLELGFQLPIGN